MSEITYTKQDDYLIPDLTLPTEPELPLGRYALMHRDYLEKHKRVTFLNLLTSGRLNAHLHQTEQTALSRLELLTKQLSKEQGVTEELKEKAPMQWVQAMNAIRSQAEEMILDELIYQYAVLRCKESQFQALDKEDILAYRKRDTQIDVLVADGKAAQKKYKDVVADHTSVDEIMLLLVKGERV